MKDPRSSSSTLPVIFSDGEQESSLGKVSISTFNFKHFQAAVAEKLGLSSHQFSIYLTNRKNRGSRVPVTGKLDFTAVSLTTDCIFLIILKQSRRERRRRTRGGSEFVHHRSDPPPNMMLLRRDGNTISLNGGSYVGGGGGFSGLELDRSGFGFERRIEELRIQKEMYLMNMGFGSGANRTVICQECSRAKEIGIESGFHWCVHDTITVGFRSPAGPIARPSKG
ncbi:hypothetical protein M5689_015518 [Euphorbia peplus]|nr:hypothetical protein M5689_015518 [Euphorbia peplus]